MNSLLAQLLPLAEDPFPPTHKAGSEFEGFFLRLESHSGRYSYRSTQHQPVSPKKCATGSKPKRSTPSRIPRLSSSTFRNNKPVGSLSQRRQRASSDSDADEAASDSSHQSPPSPSPIPRRPQQHVLKDNALSASITMPKEAIEMLTDLEPMFDSPDSYLPIHPLSGSPSSVAGAGSNATITSPPGDLILVVCELQSAPIDKRICVYLRWIVHGEEATQYQSLHSCPPSSSHSWLPDRTAPLSPNGNGTEKQASFEVIHYLPSWQLKLGARAGAFSVQPFRLDLVTVSDSYLGSLGYLQVKADGNVVVDMTLPNPARGEGGGTRVRLQSTEFLPWHPRCSSSTASNWAPLGTRGPEGWIQHLGAALPLHWYVHTTSAPAKFSLEHVTLATGGDWQREGESVAESDYTVAAGRGLLHVEKNWGQSFPSGWMWAHASSPLPEPSVRNTEPLTRLSLAGGSILGLTALLVGIHIQLPGPNAQEWDWNFTPPLAVGPQYSFPLPLFPFTCTCTSKRIHLGPGFRMQRDFRRKTLALDVWDLTKWAKISISGREDSFATQIPGPTKGGWTPAYCHQSYRCKASITLYKRSFVSVVNVVLRPWTLFSAGGGWWNQVVHVELTDRVALEFGGQFAR